MTPVTPSSFDQLENDDKCFSVNSLPIIFVTLIPNWVLIPLVSVTFDVVWEGKVLSVRIKRLSGDETAYEAVTLPVSGCLLESISAIDELELWTLLYIGVIADFG